jgi:hypothetical protein
MQYNNVKYAKMLKPNRAYHLNLARFTDNIYEYGDSRDFEEFEESDVYIIRTYTFETCDQLSDMRRQIKELVTDMMIHIDSNSDPDPFNGIDTFRVNNKYGIERILELTDITYDSIIDNATPTEAKILIKFVNRIIDKMGYDKVIEICNDTFEGSDLEFIKNTF